jgi:ribosome-associated protein
LLQKIITEVCLQSLRDSKADNILTLDIEGISFFAECIIIATANSNRHAKSISEKLIEELKNNDLEIIGSEGSADSGWIIVDCGSVVINLMKPETRELYDLEGLWGQKTLLKTSS